MFVLKVLSFNSHPTAAAGKKFEIKIDWHSEKVFFFREWNEEFAWSEIIKKKSIKQGDANEVN